MQYNERMLLNKIRENVEWLMGEYLFEPISDVQDMLGRHLQSFVNSGHLSDFNVHSRGKGNPIFDIHLKPIQSADYVTIKCVISTDDFNSKQERVQIKLDEDLFKM